MKNKSCKHNKAFPIAFVMWCPECGALRPIRPSGKTNSFTYSTNKWLYPRGYDNVLDQLEKWKTK